MKTPKVSIAIPYHDTPNTAGYLTRLLASIHDQTFRDFEIVLTKEGPFARNHNAAIQKSRGKIIKLMQLDDYFSYADSLEKIVTAFEEGEADWQITACLHNINGQVGAPHIPYWTPDIFTGNNRLGSVSTLAMRRESARLFEEPLTWLVDCDLYYRLFLEFGPPQILKSENVVIDTRTDRLTSTLSEELKAKEVEYLKRKYGK